MIINQNPLAQISLLINEIEQKLKEQNINYKKELTGTDNYKIILDDSECCIKLDGEIHWDEQEPYFTVEYYGDRKIIDLVDEHIEILEENDDKIRLAILLKER